MSLAAELRDPSGIVLSKLYPFVVARLYIPSHQTERPITLSTLHNWRRAGRVEAVYRVREDGRKSWFLRGAQIVELIGVEPAPKPKAQRVGKTRASSEAALKSEGFKNI